MKRLVVLAVVGALALTVGVGCKTTEGCCGTCKKAAKVECGSCKSEGTCKAEGAEKCGKCGAGKADCKCAAAPAK